VVVCIRFEFLIVYNVCDEAFPDGVFPAVANHGTHLHLELVIHLYDRIVNTIIVLKESYACER